MSDSHCIKSVRIRSYSGPHFPRLDWVSAFGIRISPYSVPMRSFLKLSGLWFTLRDQIPKISRISENFLSYGVFLTEEFLEISLFYLVVLLISLLYRYFHIVVGYVATSPYSSQTSISYALRIFIFVDTIISILPCIKHIIFQIINSYFG